MEKIEIPGHIQQRFKTRGISSRQFAELFNMSLRTVQQLLNEEKIDRYQFEHNRHYEISLNSVVEFAKKRPHWQIDWSVLDEPGSD